MNRLWRRLMDITELLGKSLYGLLGSRFPIVSLVLVTTAGALLGGWIVYAAWSHLGEIWVKEHPPAAVDYGQLNLDAVRQMAKERAAKPEQIISTAYQTEFTADCPENISLRIFQRGNASIAVFTKSGIKSSSGPFRLEMKDFRTFSLADQDWRELKPFVAEIASVPILEPGHPSKDFVLILAHKDHLEIGSRSMNEILVWPPADPSPVQRYRLGLKVYGLDTEKAIQLCIRWERGSSKIEFMEYSDSIPPSAF